MHTPEFIIVTLAQHAGNVSPRSEWWLETRRVSGDASTVTGFVWHAAIAKATGSEK